MNSGQIRLNPVTQEWVIYAPARRKRPQDFRQPEQQEDAPEEDPNCPFCPINNETLEPRIIEIANATHTGWQTRVVPNKFPILTPEHSTMRCTKGMYIAMQGYGTHDVIIESPKHNETPATMPLEALEIVIETYHQRYLELMATNTNMMVILFRNHGKKAGASLRHPHSQIIGTGIVPQHFRWQEQEAQRYYDKWANCLYCDILKHELDEGDRIVLENHSFVALVPYAADVPFETWIMPKRHQGDFGSISEDEKGDFAAILQQMLRKLYFKLNNPDYNYVINTAARYRAEEPQVHWYCQIKPRFTTPAGFEIAAGININPSIPELDAAFLRGDDSVNSNQ
ncbi:galactose-1-phosphate uridylyltransferase [Spirulina sp. CS-785/01]|uniref:galactose-1-phosphate uridylyltransferase n=1 Tax=Spirulina sp. CS-785/01 TaxID=3021716 RepID=UPI00232FEE2C|nr:galactose-1-phosphate uridylyltransferase [Spirulina sp. CS-785/01]MDB9315174.1 galactose-1-phosphate uridylyltransferase [Spirulina sp. CS-785/01]